MAEHALQVRHAAPGADEAEVDVLRVVGDGDVHRLTVQRNRQRIVADHSCAPPVQRVLGAWDIGDHDIERGWRRADKSRNQPEEQAPGHESGQCQLLSARQAHEHLLAVGHRGVNPLQASTGVLDVGVEVAQHGAHLVAAALAVVLVAQAHRDHGDQRVVGQRALFHQISAQRPGRHRQHDVVEGDPAAFFTALMRSRDQDCAAMRRARRCGR